MEVINKYGVKIDYDAAVDLMDDDIRETLAAELAPCTDQEFFTATARRTPRSTAKSGRLTAYTPATNSTR